MSKNKGDIITRHTFAILAFLILSFNSIAFAQFELTPPSERISQGSEVEPTNAPPEQVFSFYASAMHKQMWKNPTQKQPNQSYHGWTHVKVSNGSST